MCRGVAKNIACKTDEPQTQRVHQALIDTVLLTSFISGLDGVPGRQVRYANPQTMSEDLKIALSVRKAEKQERCNETFYTRFDKSVRRIPDPQIGRDRKAEVSDTLLTHVRKSTHISNCIVLRAVAAGQKTPSSRNARKRRIPLF
jgi:hypothetical protein